MKVKGMTVQRLTSILQTYCHEGGSLDEVEIYDKEGNRVCSIEDIELKKGLDTEVCKITIHTRDIFDIEDYLKEKEKESQPREDYDNFHDGAGIGINSENFIVNEPRKMFGLQPNIRSHLERVISAGLELNKKLVKGGHKVNNCSFADSKYLTRDIVCPLSTCIVEWLKSDPYDVYEQNECICTLTDIETGAILNIYAPCRLMVQDICCPDVAFEGYPILEYSPLD